MHKMPRRRPRLRVRLLMAVLVAVFASLVAELAVRIMGLAREIGPSFTEWHATDGLHVRRSICVTRSTPEYTMRFTSNSAGFRGPELPPEIGHSILCLGDSFTMGYGIDDGQEFVALLREHVPAGWTVVNAGIGGTGNGRWLHVMRRERTRLRPAVVVMQVCSNDVDDNLREGLFTLDGSGELVEGRPAPPTMARRVQAWLDTVPGASYLHLIALGRQIGARSAPVPAGEHIENAVPTAHPGLGLQVAILRRAVSLVRDMAGVPLFLSADQSATDIRPVQALADELGVRLVRIPCRDERPDFYYQTDGHWNAAGHAYVAERVCEELRQSVHGLAALEWR